MVVRLKKSPKKKILRSWNLLMKVMMKEVMFLGWTLTTRTKVVEGLC
jgi:hypothetical protein